MNNSRLLIAVDVLDLLRTLRQREQRSLLQRFRDIAASPSRFSDYVEYDSSGRRVDVHVFGRFAIKFWDNFADRHVKILDLHAADR
ncbi:MAG TPA: hypothetical protein VMF08_06795 [Candidatus Sulfotelmatobacter sp.]|nr:hypothetical protein [Candidatus Sulfotelmatobacter sp.]